MILAHARRRPRWTSDNRIAERESNLRAVVRWLCRTGMRSSQSLAAYRGIDRYLGPMDSVISIWLNQSGCFEFHSSGGSPMTAQMNHVYIFCTAVVTLFTSLPWGLRMFSALKLLKEGSLPSFDGARMAHFGGLREQRTAWGGTVLIDLAIDTNCRSRV